jgi:hypothetical protein
MARQSLKMKASIDKVGLVPLFEDKENRFRSKEKRIFG